MGWPISKQRIRLIVTTLPSSVSAIENPLYEERAILSRDCFEILHTLKRRLLHSDLHLKVASEADQTRIRNVRYQTHIRNAYTELDTGYAALTKAVQEHLHLHGEIE